MMYVFTQNTYTYIHFQHICVIRLYFVCIVCMYVCVCTSMCMHKKQKGKRCPGQDRQYIHKHTYTYTIHSYTCNTCIYMHIHAYIGTYMYAPITVGRGLCGAVADAVGLREPYNFPNRLRSLWGLGPGRQARIWPGTPSSRAGEAVQEPPTMAEGGLCENCGEIGLSGGTGPLQGWSKTSIRTHALGCPE
jgi:hypothetical protein